VDSDEVAIRSTWRAIAGDGHDDHLDEVLVRHREPHRRYHTATHVAHVLRTIDELGRDVHLTRPWAVRLAALYHDAVYDPRSSGNEVASAALASRVAVELGWGAADVAAVGSMILATEHHAAGEDSDTAVLLDADLGVLGAGSAAYLAYVDGVREEYRHVDEDAWRRGRAAVLQGFLDRPTIFATAPMRRRCEHRARRNLAAELAGLSAR